MRLVQFSPEWWYAMTIPEPNSGCILWLGPACRDGYGRVCIPGRGSHTAHRAAYESVHGPIKRKGLIVCHRCDTPLCVNPSHLFLGTQKQNLDDMRRKGRAREWGHGRKVTRHLIDRAPLVRSVPERVPRALSNSKTLKSARVPDTIHHIRTNGIQPVWCRVTGLPSSQPKSATVAYKCPELRTLDNVPEHIGSAAGVKVSA